MISPAVIDALITAGATAEMLAAAMKADAIETEARLEAQRKHRRDIDAARQRRHRLSRTVTRDTQPIIEHARVGAGARVDDSSSSTDTSGKRSKNNRETEERTACVTLETVLDPEHAAAVIEHRKSLKAPLSARAAKALAGKFAKASDPNDAADTMLARGWQGFEPEWLENRRYVNGHGPPQKPKTGSANLIDALNAFERRSHEQHPDQEPADTAIRAIRNGSG